MVKENTEDGVDYMIRALEVRLEVFSEWNVEVFKLLGKAL